MPTPTKTNLPEASAPIDEHRVSGFACHRVTIIVEHQTDPVVYSGPDVMSKFYEHIMRESENICSILDKKYEMHTMTEKQR